MGHIGVKGLHRAVTGIALNDSAHQTCVTCAQANIKRQPSQAHPFIEQKSPCNVSIVTFVVRYHIVTVIFRITSYSLIAMHVTFPFSSSKTVMRLSVSLLNTVPPLKTF